MPIVNRIVSTIVVYPGTGNVGQAVKAAPQRIYLGVLPAGISTIYLSTKPMNGQNQGFQVGTTGGRVAGLEYYAKDTPYLCTTEWYYWTNSVTGNILLVLEEYSEDTATGLQLQTSLVIPSLQRDGSVMDAAARRMKAAIERAWRRVNDAQR